MTEHILPENQKINALKEKVVELADNLKIRAIQEKIISLLAMPFTGVPISPLLAHEYITLEMEMRKYILEILITLDWEVNIPQQDRLLIENFLTPTAQFEIERYDIDWINFLIRNPEYGNDLQALLFAGCNADCTSNIVLCASSYDPVDKFRVIAHPESIREHYPPVKPRKSISAPLPPAQVITDSELKKILRIP